MSDQPIPEYRVLLTADIEDYGSRTDAEQRTLQSTLTATLDHAADAADLNRERWRIQFGGDGVVAVLPPGTDVTRLMDRFVRELDAGLGWYNRCRSERVWTPMRLRLAVHAGLVHLDGASGWPGQHVVLPARLRDSRPVRAALAASPGADLAVIVSLDVYRDYVTQGPGNPRPTEFLPVHVAEKKQSYTAYLYLPRYNVHSIAELKPFEVPSELPTDPPPDEPQVEKKGQSRHAAAEPGTAAGRDWIGSIEQRPTTGGSIHYSAGDMHVSSEEPRRREQ